MNCLPALQNTTTSLTRGELLNACSGWLLYGDLEGWTQRTVGDRREWLSRLQDFLATRDMDFDTNGLRAFFLAITKGDAAARCRKPLKPASVKHVHTLLKALGAWLVEERFLAENPLRRVPSPILRDDGIDPYADEDLRRILAASRHTRNATRDYAILSLLADSGLRASELIGLRRRDVDLSTRMARVVCGKGGKSRTVAFGKETAAALWRLVRAEPDKEEDAFMFTGERGDGLTRGALTQLVRRIGRAAGVAHVHPHRFRHHCAISLLRGGANVFGVQAQLGHSRISTTEVYVKIADSDVREMLRVASPMDRLRAGKGSGK